MRLALMASGDFATAVLQALYAHRLSLSVVYSQPPRRAGRGQRLRATVIHQRAQELGIAVETPERLDAQAYRRWCAFDLDLAIVVSYGKILPPSWLAAPRLGCINLHASLLPRWRGAAPIVHALAAGDSQTGVTLMQMEAQLDAGPLLTQQRITIAPQETAGTLTPQLGQIAARLTVAAIERLAAGGRYPPQAQDERAVTWAPAFQAGAEEICWSQPAPVIARKIRAFAPKPGARTFLPGGARVKILAARLHCAPLPPAWQGSAAGTVIIGEDKPPRLVVICGQGALEVLALQRSGRRAMDAASFLRGYPALACGDGFGKGGYEE